MSRGAFRSAAFYLKKRAVKDAVPYISFMLRFVGAHNVRPSIPELFFRRAELAPYTIRDFRDAKTAFHTIKE